MNRRFSYLITLNMVFYYMEKKETLPAIFTCKYQVIGTFKKKHSQTESKKLKRNNSCQKVYYMFWK